MSVSKVFGSKAPENMVCIFGISLEPKDGAPLVQLIEAFPKKHACF
jgi:hypothetical protein